MPLEPFLIDQNRYRSRHERAVESAYVVRGQGLRSIRSTEHSVSSALGLMDHLKSEQLRLFRGAQFILTTGPGNLDRIGL